MNTPTVIPVPVQSAQIPPESMTFHDERSRNSFVLRERAKGWEVFLSYQGTNSYGVELYSITRRKLS